MLNKEEGTNPQYRYEGPLDVGKTQHSVVVYRLRALEDCRDAGCEEVLDIRVSILRHVPVMVGRPVT